MKPAIIWSIGGVIISGGIIHNLTAHFLSVSAEIYRLELSPFRSWLPRLVFIAGPGLAGILGINPTVALIFGWKISVVSHEYLYILSSLRGA